VAFVSPLNEIFLKRNKRKSFNTKESDLLLPGIAPALLGVEL
jgi:hypothetical protein